MTQQIQKTVSKYDPRGPASGKQKRKIYAKLREQGLPIDKVKVESLIGQAASDWLDTLTKYEEEVPAVPTVPRTVIQATEPTRPKMTSVINGVRAGLAMKLVVQDMGVEKATTEPATFAGNVWRLYRSLQLAEAEIEQALLGGDL